MIDRWLDGFDADPRQAVADLFSGRAGIGSGLRLDVPDLLLQAFPDRPELADDRQRLDDALRAWLDEMRRDYAVQVRRLGFAVYAKRLSDALVAVQLLGLARTRHHIRERRDAWLRWLVPLRLGADRDPALECWRLLTDGQASAAQTATWLRLAADPRPEYLTVALAGLQALPNNGDARSNQVLMLHALLRHAVVAFPDTPSARACFNRQFGALRGRHGPFPRAPDHWKGVLADAVAAFGGRSGDAKARALADDLQGRASQGRASPRGRRAAYTPASRQQFSNLEQEITSRRLPVEELAARLFTLLEQNRAYAETTGDSYYFVRTLHSLGNRLMQLGPLADASLERFGVLVEQALTWEPLNPYCWMLWADWFAARQRWDAREWVLREMARLFPDNEHARVELARLLIRRGAEHWDEAERWLRQVIDDYPSEPSEVVLAGLLSRRGGTEEAIERLTALLAQNPTNPIAQKALARLQQGLALDEEHDEDDADTEGALLDGDGQVPDASDAVGIDRGLTSEREGAAAQARDTSDNRVPIPGPINEVSRRGELAAELAAVTLARAQGEDRNAELIDREAAQGDALAGFYRQWLDPTWSAEPPPHAWAWHACRLWQARAARDAWAELEARFPETASETGLLRLLSGADAGTDAATRWRDRLDGENTASLRPAVRWMRDRLDRSLAGDLGERGDEAFALMASAAADVPDFATG